MSLSEETLAKVVAYTTATAPIHAVDEGVTASARSRTLFDQAFFRLDTVGVVIQ
jgi:hypothetical protein